ncbi:MAG: hypothetical protein UU64_C0002G0064 [candidate division WWE3 bacterium GW2011_GWF2_41_45]|uniref:Uncharacterized protein n=3 Tax=Katanobacteria TaxID=422282 RepID=A0A1F4W341_UNCKA|nr:MAG: hypothetical protein UU55_C0001G0054 [candidate division WWE3 bacterium GW2011_GWC2_41_23]KKS10662.1 MAG: hypothetical protein UU64_C0002G0064 [candidate division WWE3 bacterium GW2011_GWF2_41_45]KKS12327.1 MAG: hypothetical protein UU68_C0002G0053 [candidate division WWE3 bacterium GW2011_GWF1_41_53]KKS20401.1 MAG: hypothetical protein UU79_C0001G0055 [candidate division WWE3 bacterium GW2011_GWE1_41_72]KKS28301.1 MAG: hypothetical protein UU86_C0005G0014 [candidate division WWE3 bacte
MQDDLSSIHEKLQKIQKYCDERKSEWVGNQQSADTLIRLITDTVENIAPGKIHVERMGSHTNSGVPDYPVVTLTARVTANFFPVVSWRIDAGGTFPPPNLSVEDIVKQVNEGLKNIRLD